MAWRTENDAYEKPGLAVPVGAMPRSSPVQRLLAAVRASVWKVVLTGWFVCLLVLGAGMLARHLVALPAAEVDRVGPALAALRVDPERGQWLAVHVLYAECQCSQRIVDHLVHSVRPTGWSEIVLWTGKGAADPELERRGFRVLPVSREVLAQDGLEAAPLLVALDPSDHVRYVGGYTERKQGPGIEDLRILQASRDSTVAGLPVFGCAVSDRLRRALGHLPVVNL
jgi:hypothetical protein